MENDDYLVILYDYYSMLLNEKQRLYFEEYYFDNLSLSEISINENKSRNAIHNIIKSVSKKLLEYEDVMKCYEKDKKIKDIIKDFPLEYKKKIEDIL